MTFLALVRHGETDWNIDGRLQGSSDIDLNATGRAQARRAAAELASPALAEPGWTALITSPLARAADTARIIGSHLGLPEPVAHDDLVERRFGAAEGMTDYEAFHTWPHGRYPGMEPHTDLVRRTRSRIDAIASDHQGGRVIVVAHGGVIRAVLGTILGSPSPRIRNAGIATLEHNGAGWTVHTVNSVPLAQYRRWDRY